MQVPCLPHSCSQKDSAEPVFEVQYFFMYCRSDGSAASMMAEMLVYARASSQNCW